MRRTWGSLGGQLGLLCVAIGILLIGLGWNGAAGVDFPQGQIPYLLSGGALGLALVVLGATLIVVQTMRRDRARLEAQLAELNHAVARLANAVGEAAATNGQAPLAMSGDETVLVGDTSFHSPDCRLVTGLGLQVSTVTAAQAEGLDPCRVCRPAGSTYATPPR